VKIKILAGIYVSILVAIIFLVDSPATQPLFHFVYKVPYGDKIGHFCLMGVFSFLLNWALEARRFKAWKINFPFGNLIALFVVTAEEVSQIWVRGRTFDWGDLLFDFVGILLFGELARFVVKRQMLTRSSQQI
jgi:VanZ family protein